MTTIAMGAGMLPIALGWAPTRASASPMAIVVIGGLITSTFLSLLVIPVVFTYVDDAVLKINGCSRQPPASQAAGGAGRGRCGRCRADRRLTPGIGRSKAGALQPA